jgi:hypothetical protein
VLRKRRPRRPHAAVKSNPDVLRTDRRKKASRKVDDPSSTQAIAALLIAKRAGNWAGWNPMQDCRRLGICRPRKAQDCQLPLSAVAYVPLTDDIWRMLDWHVMPTRTEDWPDAIDDSVPHGEGSDPSSSPSASETIYQTIKL